MMVIVDEPIADFVCSGFKTFDALKENLIHVIFIGNEFSRSFYIEQNTDDIHRVVALSNSFILTNRKTFYS